MSQQHNQQQQYYSKQRLLQQQQQQHQQQRAWHYEHANNNMNMFAGTGIRGGSINEGNRNIPGRSNIGYDLEMGGGTSAYYGGFATNQLQRQQQQQHAMQIARRHQQIAQQQHHQQQQYSQNYQQHEQQQRLIQQQQQPQHQLYSHIKSEPNDDAIEQMLTPTIEMEELIIKSEPPDEQAYNNFLRQQQQKQHTLPFKSPIPSSSSAALSKPILPTLQPTASATASAITTPSSINPEIQQFYPQVSIKEEFPRPAEQQQQKPPNFPRLKVQTERSGTLPICQRCKQVFLKKHSYVQHVSQSTCDIVEYDFKCDVCSMSFMSSEELTAHEKLHRQNKFFCHKYCGKYFDSIEVCELHEFQHHEYATYVCNICSATFPSRELLFSHMPQHRQQPRFDCPVCRLWFQTPLELHQHRIASPYFCGKFYDENVRSNDVKPQVMHDSPQMAIQRPQFNSPDARSININTPHIAQGMSRRYFPAIPNNSHLPPSPTASSLPHRVFPPDNFVVNPIANRNPAMLPQTSGALNARMKPEIKMEPDLLFSKNEYSPRSTLQAPPNQQRFINEFNDDSFTSASSSNASHSFSSEFANFGSNSHVQISRPEVVDDSEDAICCVQKCGTRKSACPSLQYFRFPRDEKYLHQWLHNLKMLHHPSELNFEDLRICSLHFPKRCINRYSLCYWAVPTFNLGHDEVANIYQNREITNTFTSGENARCSMPGCNSQRGETNMKFYNFPKEVKMLIKWCQNARLPVHTKEPRHFCSRHFEDRCFGKFRLKPWAVPTLHLGTPYGRIHDNPSVLILEEKKCCLQHCKRARSSDFNLSLYRFPRDETLLRRWCYNLRLDPDVYRGKNHKICSNHFIKEVLGLRKLSPGAVPTLNLGHNDTFNFYENELYTAPAPPPPVASTPKVFTFHNNSAMSANSSMSSSVSHYATASLSSSPTNFSPMSTPINATTNLMDFADYCLVTGCTSTRTTEGVTLHTIPRRYEQMLKWCHNLKMEPNQIHKGLRICNLHFEPYCIGGCMRPFAVPTLNLGHDDPNIHKNPDVIKKLNIRETCCVQICKRNRDRDRANLHRFPSKMEMLVKWCGNLKKPLPDGTRLFNDAICEVHFEDRCLRNKRIEKWAVPTLNLGHDDIIHHLPSEEEVAEMWARQNLPTANTGDEEGICCVETCKRNPEIDDIRLYRVPDNPEILSKWAHNLQIEVEELPTVRICNLHFEPRCIGKKLHSWAIPTMNLAKHVEPLFQNPSHNLMMYRKEKSLQRSFEVEKPAVDEFGEPLPKPTWAPRCCLPHCRNKRGVNNVQLFRIPYNNRSMMAKWCHNLQIPLTQLKPRRVCSAHFEPHVLTKRCPMPQAVPTLDLNTPAGYKIYQNPSRLKTVKLSAQTICSVESCQKTRSDGVQLFRLPLKGPQLRKWAHNLRLWENNKMPNLTSRAQMRVCSRHFEPHSFGAKRLVPSAIPTLNVGHDQLDDLFPNEAQPFSEIQCAINGCNSIKDADNYVRLFKFPIDDEDLLWKWCNNLKMNPIDCAGRICQRHFEEDCMGPKNLYKWAIPTLELGHNDAEIELIPNPKPEDRYTETIAKCLVPGCGKTRKYDEIQLNSFPKNPRAFRRWKHNLKLEYLDFKKRDQYRICTDHFEIICQGKNRLKHGAIPTLKLGHDDTSDLYEVKAENMHYMLFGKPVPVKRPIANQSTESNDNEEDPDVERNGDEDVEMANDGENETNLSSLELENKCCFPDCIASKTVLREIYELPKAEAILAAWCKVMKVEREDLNAQSKLCGLHYIDVYEATKDRELDENDTENKTDLDKLALAYYRACNSLTIRSAHCSVPGCKISQLNSEYRLYTFPYNRDLIEKWTQNTRVEVDEHRRYLHKVCGIHFEPYCLTDTQKLRPWAIPTLHLNRDDKDSQELHQNPDLNSVERRMLGRITYKCCVSACGRERTDDNNVRLFNFPTDETVLEKWAHNLQLRREKCPLYKICDNHFEEYCMGQSRLRSWAIPTLNLGYDSDRKIELFRNPTKIAEKYSNIKETMSNEMSEQVTESGDESNSSTMPITNVKIKKSLHVLKCCVPRCRRSRLKHGVNLFSFPSHTVLFKKWCHNLQLSAGSVNKHTRVCNTHFNKRCFDDSKQLRTWALPTLHLGHDTSLYQIPKAMQPQQTPTSSLCALPNCTNNNITNKEIVLVRFPDDKQLLQKWCENLKLTLNTQQAKEKRICLNEHFESKCILADGVSLRPDSVPTQNLGYPETPAHKNNTFETEVKHVENSDTFPSENTSAFDEKSVKFENPERKPRAPNSNAPICCLKHCRKEKTAEQHLTTFGFPKDPQVLAKWCDNLLLQPEDCIGRVCIEHFELRVLGNRRLKPGAVPTLNLGHSEPLKHGNGEKLNVLTTDASTSQQSAPQSANVDIKTSPKKFIKCLTTPNQHKEENKSEVNDAITAPDNANDDDFYAEKLDHSVFRLCCLKHCRRRIREREKQTETTDNNGGSSEIQPLRLFKFPREPRIVRRWAHNLRMPFKYCKMEKRKLRICELHFDPNVAFEGNDLKPKAIPTLDLGYDAAQLGIKLFENRRTIKTEKPKFCCIKNCSENITTNNVSSNEMSNDLNNDGVKQKLFPFPKRGAILRKWSHNTKQDSYTAQTLEFHICAQHFEPKCFDDNNELKPDMVPTLNLDNDDMGAIYTNDDLDNSLPAPPVSLNITINDNKGQRQQQNRQSEKETQLICCVPNCIGLQGQYIVNHFPFPKDEDLRSKWCHNLRINNDNQIENKYICSLHFQVGCIRKRVLNKLALPTENLNFENVTNNLIPDGNETHGANGIEEDNKNKTTIVETKYTLFENPAEVFENPYPTVIPRCSVRTCNKSHRHDGVRLFQFPKNRIYYLKWAHNLGLSASLKAIQNYRVCELHFDSNCMRNKRLLSGAIPTLALDWSETTDVNDKPSGVGLFESNSGLLSADVKTGRKRSFKTLKGSIKCAIKGCNMLRSSAIAMISVPREEGALRDKWLAHVTEDNTSKPLGTLKLCALHFIQAYRKLCLSSNEENLKTEEEPGELSLLRSRYDHLLQSAYVKQLICAVAGCNVTYIDNIIFHQFPKEPNLFEKWQHNTQVLADPQRRYIHKICSLHFEERCFGSKRLRGWAIPTLNLPKPKNDDKLYENPQTREISFTKPNVSTADEIFEETEICCVPNCTTNDEQSTTATNTNDWLEFWTLPVNEPEMLAKWLHNIGLNEADEDRKKLRKRRICSRHFATFCFSEKNRLRHWAVPTLELPTPVEELHQNPDDIVLYRMCVIPNCHQIRDHNAGIHLYSFPKTNVSYFDKWVHNVRLDADRCRKARICTLHFEKHMIKNRNLRKGAVPTMDLGHNETEIFTNPKKLKKVKKMKTDVALRMETESTNKAEKLNESLESVSHKSIGNAATCCMENCKIKTEVNAPNADNINVINEKPRLFGFPKIDWLLQKWCENTRQPIEGANKLWICECHFEAHAIGRSKPRPLAVPTLLLGNENWAPVHDNPKQLKRYHAEEKESGEVKYVRGNCCAIISCFDSGVRLYKYPTKGILLQKWAENCRHHPYQAARYNFRICGKHFTEDCFETNGRLRFGAVPTLHLGHDESLENPAKENTNTHSPLKLHASEFWVRKRQKKFKKNCVLLIPTDEKQNIVVKKCGVPNCSRSKQDDGVRLYKFPNDQELLTQWCHNLRLNPIDCKDLLICNMHFESRCINQRGVFKRAVPTLLLGHSNIGGHSLIENPVDLQQPTRYYHCCVTGCESSRQTDSDTDLVLSAFPKCRTLFEKWAHNMNMAPTNELWHNIYNKVCNRHFESFCYERRRLRHGAIPTLNLGHDNLSDIYKITEEELTAEKKQIKPFKRASIRGDHSRSDNQEKYLRQLYCSYSQCQEYEKHKFVHAFEVPKVPLKLQKAWCDTILMAQKMQEQSFQPMNENLNKLQLCPIHFKMIYEEHKPLLDTLLEMFDQLTSEEQENLTILKETNLKVSQMARIRVQLCGVPGCKSNIFNSATLSNPNAIRLYSLPVNRQQSLKWYHNIGVPAEEEMRTSFRICELHFDAECFAEHSKRLRAWALPTVNLPDMHNREMFLNPTSNSAERFAQKTTNFKCCVSSCVNATQKCTAEEDGQTTNAAPLLFPFPRDELLLRKWLHNTGLRKREVFQARICQLHFEEHCFNKRLCNWAIPTLKLDLSDESNLYRNPKVKKSFMAKKRKTDDGKQTPLEDIESAVDTVFEALEHSSVDQNTNAEKEAGPLKKIESKRESLMPQPSEQNISNDDDLEQLSVKPSISATTPFTNDSEDSEDIPLIAKRLKLIDDKDVTKENLDVDSNFDTNITISEENEHQQFEHETNDLENESLEPSILSNTEIHSECLITIKDEPIEIDDDDNTNNDNSGNEVNYFNLNDILVDYGRSNDTKPVTFSHGVITPPANNTGLMIVKAESLQGNVRQKDFEIVSQKKQQDSIDTNICCCIPNCINSQSNRKPFAILHKFPLQAELFAKWRHNCQLNSLTESAEHFLRICERHFESKCYRNGKLIDGVVPTLDLGNNSAVEIFDNRELFGRQRNVPLLSNDSNVKSVNNNDIKCCLPHCEKRQNERDNIHLFKLPESLMVLDKWLHNLPISYDEKQPWKYLVCSQHFEECCFKSGESNEPPVLHKWAIPTLNLGDHAPFLLFTNQDIQEFDENCYDESYDMSEATENSLLDPIYEKILPPAITSTSRTPTSMMSSTTYEHPLTAGNNSQYVSTSYKRCCISHCRSTRTDTVKLFHFPGNYEDACQWQRILGMQLNERELRTKLVCSQHFEPQFVGQRRLCGRNVMPTLNLGSTALGAPLIVCSVPGCRSTSQTLKIFTKFPEDLETLKKWCKNLRIDPRNYVKGRYNICQEHFTPNSFANNGESLKCEAVPTVKLPTPGSSGFEGVVRQIIQQPELQSTHRSGQTPLNRPVTSQKYCCAPDCPSTVASFDFPRNPTLRSKWCHNLRVDKDDNVDEFKVCRKHFQQYCIRNERLHPEAVPTLSLGRGITRIYQNSATYEQQTSTTALCPPHAVATTNSNNSSQYFRPMQTSQKQSNNFAAFAATSEATYVDLDYNEIYNGEVDDDNGNDNNYINSNDNHEDDTYNDSQGFEESNL